MEPSLRKLIELLACPRITRCRTIFFFVNDWSVDKGREEVKRQEVTVELQVRGKERSDQEMRCKGMRCDETRT